MYRVPSEFIRQKTALFGPITVAHAAGAFGGYLLAQSAGDSPWLSLLGVALGLATTTLKVQGLVLYQFVPLAAAFLLRKLTGDLLEAEEEQAATSPATFLVRDEEGRPLVFGEE
jgi:4-amino-4-deoxy-L-arabinose transferase-like glycosyltransferase